MSEPRVDLTRFTGHKAGPWEQITGKYMAIDLGETPQVFRPVNDADLALMKAAPDLLAEVASLRAQLDAAREREKEGVMLLVGAGGDLHAALNPLLTMDPREVRKRRDHWESVAFQVAALSSAPRTDSATEGPDYRAEAMAWRRFEDAEFLKDIEPAEAEAHRLRAENERREPTPAPQQTEGRDGE